MPNQYLIKRSMRIAGHRTSVALEPEFWEKMEASAKRMQMSLPALIAELDATRAKLRPEQSLASALRIHALDVATGHGRTDQAHAQR